MPTSVFGRHGRLCLGYLLTLLLFSSCASTRYYNQRTMFRLTDDKGRAVDTARLRVAVNRTARNYLIQPNDYLNIQVNTNKGERILDPNGELQFGGAGGGAAPVARTATTTGAGARGATTFLVQADGTVTLPLVNRVRVSGFSLLQADSVLKASYSKYYIEPFVMTRVTNNRVILLGAQGGRVIPLENDNMNLLEVLALAGGVDGGGGGGSSLYRYGGRADNIRIIRGNLKYPQIEQIDLTTIAGMRRASLQVEPNDIIYIDPIRRPLLENLTDSAPILGFAASITSLVITIAYLVIR
ncbi:polysaccharide biosynthesis/export family protein [Hymenobacter caeli]|uniref:Polysaccharide export outer membrane protein n=1 Tax=Hymenobacter caeli TaxID=2735894 RepID=A0ABX2FLR5_9BACT|nr:polysaccharide biosynthesis/export family protein [Hymenobacter caeli]NRT18088.1 polysaccharide export outer membrane protein [Hymenobacter caeli]